jgi:glyoxylase-like metal-dependent hydrolase (beta-lactamase superfamily II)
MSLEIVQMEVGLGQNFCEVIGCSESRRAALVDPAFEVDRLLAAASERDWSIDALLLTHSHLDHINGLGEAFEACGARVYCHAVEVDAAASYVPREQIVAVSHEARIAIGNSYAVALHTPGHTEGCICWYLPEADAVITGDVLFVGSVGKSADAAAMKHSLVQVLGALPEETRVYPGHDYGKTPTSTLAWELTAQNLR